MITFTIWWEDNKILYEPHVSKEIAHKIWCDAVDALNTNFLNKIS